MNYIKQLQAEVAALKLAAQKTENEIGFFISFLQSEKFSGVETVSGERKDWIATPDVIARMMELRNALHSSEVDIKNKWFIYQNTCDTDGQGVKFYRPSLIVVQCDIATAEDIAFKLNCGNRDGDEQWHVSFEDPR